MRWLLNNTIALAIVLLIHKAKGEAMFELMLNNFQNELGRSSEGHCCSGFENSSGKCSEKCLTKFRICLNVYQQEIDIKAPCMFGEKVTDILGANSVIPSQFSPLKFKMESWQGTFSLIIEAWHENANSTLDKILINRLKTQHFLAVGTQWKNDVHKNEHSTLDVQFRVVCQENYYGPECRTWCKARDDTFGHYNCDGNGNKVCLPGWEAKNDSYCNQAKCSPGCNGDCDKPNECNCKLGWKGKKCDECVLYPGCDHGTCEKAWECVCKEGWGGLFCNQDLNYCTNHQPCKNGATCFNTAPGSYSCQCPPGFNGTNCEIINDSCANSPCQNGGTCLDTGDEGFVCQCPSGFSGRYCELSGRTCSNRPCLNGGRCTDHSAGFQCHCPTGYEGVRCELLVNDCMSSPCLNGGSCVDAHRSFTCFCPIGFTGARCETNINDCSHKPCLNGGTCVDGVNSFECRCRPGFDGLLCQKNVYCKAVPCANGGLCIDGVKNVKCKCQSGWYGKFCTKRVVILNICLTDPCDNGGMCRLAPDLASGYRCTCPHGYVGPRCSVMENSIISEARQQPESMTGGKIAMIIAISVAVPIIALICYIVICMRKRRRSDFSKSDEEARRQNEANTVHNAVNNKKLVDKMIFNSLEYPSKPINTDPQSYRQSVITVDKMSQEKLSPAYSKNTIENTYTIAPSRSTKTLNTEISRLSLASRLEKDLDAYAIRNSPSICDTPSSEVCNTPGAQTPVSCNSPIVYLIENNINNKDDRFIATEV